MSPGVPPRLSEGFSAGHSQPLNPPFRWASTSARPRQSPYTVRGDTASRGTSPGHRRDIGRGIGLTPGRAGREAKHRSLHRTRTGGGD